MGRKSRKKHYRGSDAREIEDPDEENPDCLTAMELEREYQRTEQFLIIRRQMLDYCNEISVPLCEYLTPELMLKFANWMETESY